MAVLTRKEREIVERESRILELASNMLKTRGYLGLNMDRIAAEMEYSKGTIYQHFRNKEDIILALANKALDTRRSMFRRAADWAGNTRARIVAIGAAAERFVEQYPQHFEVEQIVRSSSIWEKTREESRLLMRSCEEECLQIVGGIVRDGLEAGDLKLPEGRTPQDLVFGLWSLNFGAYTIIASSDSLAENGIIDPVAALRLSQFRLLDGYHWQPLSDQIDYGVMMDQIKQALFSELNV